MYFFLINLHLLMCLCMHKNQNSNSHFGIHMNFQCQVSIRIMRLQLIDLYKTFLFFLPAIDLSDCLNILHFFLLFSFVTEFRKVWDLIILYLIQLWKLLLIWYFAYNWNSHFFCNFIYNWFRHICIHPNIIFVFQLSFQ